MLQQLQVAPMFMAARLHIRFSKATKDFEQVYYVFTNKKAGVWIVLEHRL